MAWDAAESPKRGISHVHGMQPKYSNYISVPLNLCYTVRQSSLHSRVLLLASWAFSRSSSANGVGCYRGFKICALWNICMLSCDDQICVVALEKLKAWHTSRVWFYSSWCRILLPPLIIYYTHRSRSQGFQISNTICLNLKVGWTKSAENSLKTHALITFCNTF